MIAYGPADLVEPREQPSANQRMQQRVERAALVRVREHELAQRSPIELAAGGQHVRAERVANRRQRRLARRDHLACDLVGVDDLRAELHEHVGYERFAARDRRP